MRFYDFRTPVLIAFEGLDGSGKSTSISFISKKIEEYGFKVGIFKYSSSRKDLIGKTITYLYKSESQGSFLRRWLIRFRPIQAILYNIQARLNYCDIGEISSLDVVIYDRCAVTAFIAHTNIEEEKLGTQFIISFLESQFVPDYVIYLKIDPIMALSRISSRSQGNWTDEEVDKIGAMEHNYNRLLNATWCPYPLTKIKKWFVVNGMRPQVEVVHDIEVIIKQILNIERGEKLEKKM